MSSRRIQVHPWVLLAAYVVVALMPVGLAAWQGLPPRPFLDEFSSALAMVGFSMMLVEFVLSGRFRWVTGRTGIDITMRFHQLIARALAVFILLHPFLYSLPTSNPLPWDASGQLTLDLGGAAFVTGGLAWLLLPVLVLAAMFRRETSYRYETWRLMHGLGAALIALLTLHHAVNAGRYSGGTGLTVFWIIMISAALLTLLYVYLLGPLIRSRHPYRMVSVRPVASATWELVIEPESGTAADFEAGQFVWLSVGHSPFSMVEHPFSISSSPSERPRLGFMIKEVGDFTRSVGSVPVGTKAYLDGPHGNLVLPGQSDAKIVFIAGGIGIAPIMSMLRQLRADSDPRSVKLVYGNRVADQIAYGDELEDMKQHIDLQVHHLLQEPPTGWSGDIGTIDEPMLRKLFGSEDDDDCYYIVCGPAPMIDSVESSLARIGIPLSRVVAEKFSYD